MSSKLFLTGNRGAYFVFDEDMFCYGVGKTPDEAIQSAKTRTDMSIEGVEDVKATLH